MVPLWIEFYPIEHFNVTQTQEQKKTKKQKQIRQKNENSSNKNTLSHGKLIMDKRSNFVSFL